MATAKALRDIAKSLTQHTSTMDDAIETLADFVDNLRAVLHGGLEKQLDDALEALRDASKGIDSDSGGVEGAADEVDDLNSELEELRSETEA